MKKCAFIDNSISAVTAIGSTIRIEESVLFYNIAAISGAAFIFSKSSMLLLPENSHIVFKNNRVRHYGAGFYIITEEFSDTSTSIKQIIKTTVNDLKTFISLRTYCFLHVLRSRSKTRLTFINNTAERGGDVVYGGLVASGYDGSWNCLLSFKKISNMTWQTSDMPYRRITSAPSRVCLCRDEQPDCLTVVDTTSRVLYPGQTMTVSAAVVGQDFGTVKGEVHAQFLSSVNASLSKEQQIVQYNNTTCKHFRFKVYSSYQACEAKLVLTTDDREVAKSMNVEDNSKLNESWSILLSEGDYNTLANNYILIQAYDTNFTSNTIDNFFTVFVENYQTRNFKYILRFPQEIYNYPLYIDVSINSCPLGFHLSNSECDCIELLHKIPTVECDIQGPSITRGGSVWIGTYDNNTIAVSKYCPLLYCKTETTLLSLHKQHSNYTHSQCNYNHAGILCGGCQQGLSLALGSEQCLQCSNAYISLILPFALAGIVLVLFIKAFNFTVSKGIINGFIFYANVINANKHLYYNQTSTSPTTLFIAWFNLDLGIQTCFYDGLTAYSRTWLQFVFPVYIWCLAVGFIILANYSQRVAKLSGNNGVPVLATLFLLSYAKMFTRLSHTPPFTQRKVIGWCGHLTEILSISVLNMLLSLPLL